MKILRKELNRSLGALKLLGVAASSYLALEWSPAGIAFAATCPLGYVRSSTFEGSPNPTIASHVSLHKCLTDFIVGDEVTLDLDRSRHLWMRSCDNPSDEVRVTTVLEPVSWKIRHTVGKIEREFDPALFLDIEVKKFEFHDQPVLKGSRLMIPTVSGIIFRDGLVIATAFPYPRDVFLRAICGRKLDRLSLTSLGYWSATFEGMDLVIAGHRTGDSLFETCNVAAGDKIVSLPARLVEEGLEKAGLWAGDQNSVLFDSASGHITTLDAKNYRGRFSLGVQGGWPSFAISRASARTVAAAIRQAQGELVDIVAGGPDRVRFRRGLWEVNVKSKVEGSMK